MRYFLPFFLFLIPFCLPAQVNHLKFTAISTHQGLSHGTVTSMIQDREGFMWFGTHDGLNRYDGYHFEHFEHNPEDSTSISNNTIRVLFQDRQGNIWVGTNDGLNKLDKATHTFTHYFHQPNNPHSISDNSIHTIFEDQQGILWIGTYLGLNKFDRSRNTFTLFEHIPGHPDKWAKNAINTICEDRQNNLWVGTNQGLSIFDRKTGKFVRFPFSSNFDSTAGFAVTAISEDRSGNLWVGTMGGGLKLFDRKSHTFIQTYQHSPTDPHSISDDFIFAILEDSFGRLWVGTQYQGLSVKERNSTRFINYKATPTLPDALSDNTILSLCEDRSKVMWIGTFSFGLNKVDLIRKRIIHLKDFVVSNEVFRNNVQSVHISRNGAVWIGNPLGLHQWERVNNYYTRHIYESHSSKPLTNATVCSIREDRRGHLWLGLGGMGLKDFDPSSGDCVSYVHQPADNTSLPSDFVSAVYEDKSGVIWIGTVTGLSRFNPAAKNFTTYKPDFVKKRRFHVLSMIEDAQGTMWVATSDEGLFIFDRAEGTFTLIRQSDERESNRGINCLLEDTQGTIWVALFSGGLARVDRKYSVLSKLTAPKVLTKTVVVGMLEDNKGNLWLSTTKNGIFCYSPVTKGLRRYDVRDGLQGNEFLQASCKAPTGELFFGGKNGLNFFHPDSLHLNPYPPAVVITGFKVFDEFRKIKGEEIVLPFHDNFFSFDFSALSYALPEKNEYAYQLEGVDKKWVFAGTRRYASYTNLDPGEYVFRVKAANHDGIWNEKGVSLKIVITPPWWRTLWAYIGYGFIGLVILYSFRIYTIKQERLKSHLHLKSLESQKLQEINKLKSRFFANISHEFRTPLTLILSPLEKMISQPGDNYSWKESLPQMYRSARRLLQLINQLLDISKLEAGKLEVESQAGEIIAFMRAMVNSFSSAAVSKGVELSFSYNRDEQYFCFDKDKLEKITTNLIANALKFTPAGGVVRVQLTVEENNANRDWKRIVLEVKDTGIGIPPDQLPYIFDRFYQADNSHTRAFEGTGIGLSLTKELIELQQGSIRVVSQEGEGTTFWVELPFKVTESAENASEETRAGKSTLLPVLPAGEDEHEIPKNERKLEDQTDEALPLLLIVEDNEDLRRYLRNVFQAEYRIIEAHDGKEGLQQAVSTIPDLILSDWMMPRMDGRSLCEKLKTDVRTCHIPFILLTAKANVENKIEGLETGADDYIGKPFHEQELQVRTKNLINGRKQLREQFGRRLILEPADIKVTSADEKFLQKVKEIIEANLSNSDFTIETLEKEAAMSHMQFLRKFKALTNQTPSDFLRNYRLKRAASLLEQRYESVSQIAYEVGFSNLSYFAKCFRQVYGVTPSEYGVSKTESL